MTTLRQTLLMQLLLLVAAAGAQVQTARYGVSMAANSYGFYEYLPQGYNSSTQTYPLILFLHGYGQRGHGDSAELPRVLEGVAKVIQDGKFPTSFTVNGQTHRFIVLTPQFTGWPSPGQIEQALNYAVSHYRVNQQRIYLTGYSMGGGLVWDYVSYSSSFANRIAAALPVAGSSFASAERGRVIAAANLPVWATHNNGDPTVAVSKTDNYIAAINSPTPPVPAARKTIFLGKDHDCWAKTYDPLFKENNMNVYEWMLQYQRKVLTAGSNSPVCAGSMLTLTASPVSGASYKWTGPNGFTSNSRTPALSNITSAAAGVYTVKITKGDSTATATTTVAFQGKRYYYHDPDRDNYGNSEQAWACRAPSNYVIASGDCNDTNKDINPGAPELCDGIDNNCNGLVDENPAQLTFYKDYDKDGYGNANAKVVACKKPSGYVTIAGDCNDANAKIYPNAPEICDGLDNDCDGTIDEGLTQKTFYKDGDKDSWGTSGSTKKACAAPPGYVSRSGDCNDANAAVNPGATEVAGNSVDDNCNGKIDETILTVTTRAIVPAVVNEDLTVTVAPNPTSNQFRITIHSAATAPVSIAVYNSNGGRLWQQGQLRPGTSIYVGYGFAPGIYLLEAVQGRQRIQQKIVKLP